MHNKHDVEGLLTGSSYYHADLLNKGTLHVVISVQMSKYETSILTAENAEPYPVDCGLSRDISVCR